MQPAPSYVTSHWRQHMCMCVSVCVCVCVSFGYMFPFLSASYLISTTDALTIVVLLPLFLSCSLHLPLCLPASLPPCPFPSLTAVYRAVVLYGHLLCELRQGLVDGVAGVQGEGEPPAETLHLLHVCLQETQGSEVRAEAYTYTLTHTYVPTGICSVTYTLTHTLK